MGEHIDDEVRQKGKRQPDEGVSYTCGNNDSYEGVRRFEHSKKDYMKKDAISQIIVDVFITLRPVQWLKNLSLYAPLVFGGAFFRSEGFVKVSKAFLIFCAISSAMYVVNDLLDASRDRRHPHKKYRPVASGKLDTRVAAVAVIILLVLGLSAAYLLELYFFLTAMAYVLLQIFYSLFLRQVIIMDALAIALGFILRVFAGAWVLPVPLSSWLVLATIGLALLLAFGKRRSEKTILEAEGLSSRTRRTLEHYPDTLLDSMISMSATFAIISYSLFTFQTSPQTPLLETYLPVTISRPKLMMLTIPLVIYTVARYLYVIYEKKEGESPERVLLSDYPLLLSAVFWGLSVMAVIYWL